VSLLITSKVTKEILNLSTLHNSSHETERKNSTSSTTTNTTVLSTEKQNYTQSVHMRRIVTETKHVKIFR